MQTTRLAMLTACIATLAATAAAQEGRAAAALPRTTTVDEAALHMPGAIWNTTVNGMAFQQYALATHNGWQYTTWWDAERRLCLARRPLPDGEWQAIRFADHLIQGNDTHNAAVLGISRDGVIHLSFDHHGHTLRYRASQPGVASNPERVRWDVDIFGPVLDALRLGEPIKGVTYPRFIPMPDGRLQLIYRSGGSGNGDWMMATYAPEAGWTAPEMVISRKGMYGLSGSRCAYLNGIAYDAAGRLHLSWVWRETGDPMTNHDFYYAYSDDEGATWMTGAGEPAGIRGETPMALNTPGLRFRRIDMHRGVTNSTTQITDSRNRVHIVNMHLPDEVPSQLNWEHTRQLSRYVHYWRDAEGTWRDAVIPFIGTRPQLFADSADNLYLVTTGDRYHPDDRDLVILAADAADGWSEWREACRVKGPFTGQPQVDRSRGDDVLAVYIQEFPGEEEDATRSALRVFEFQTGPQR